MYFFSIGTKRLGAECHTQGKEVRMCLKVNIHTVGFGLFMGSVDSYLRFTIKTYNPQN